MFVSHCVLLFCKPLKVAQVQGSKGIPEEQAPPRMFTVADLYSVDQYLSNAVFIVILRQSFILILLTAKALTDVYFLTAYIEPRWIKSLKHIFRDIQWQKCVQHIDGDLVIQSCFSIWSSLDPIYPLKLLNVSYKIFPYQPT